MLKTLKPKLLLLREEIEAQVKSRLPRAAKHRPYQLAPKADCSAAQQGIAIVAIIKDEAPYLAEWLEFHLMLGVRHICLYDNGSTDETPDVLAPYQRDGLVTLVPWHNFSLGLNPQRLAYTHAMTNFCWNDRWVAPIDVDEFLFPVDGESLERTLDEFLDLPVLNMPWINFGPSGHQKKPDGLVIENYTERAAFPPPPEQYSLLRYKSIVNPREVDYVATHWFFLRGRGEILINDRRVEFPAHRKRDARYATADKLRLHHYFTRSHEEIERKLSKGRVSKAGRVNENALDRRLEQYEMATEKDEAILRFVPNLRTQLAKRVISTSRTSEHETLYALS